jgi:hypothetical protein
VNSALASTEAPFYAQLMSEPFMKIEFKKSEMQSSLDFVYINGVLAGEFISDVEKESYLFVPDEGDRILLTRVAYDEACKLLTGELTQLFIYRGAKAA